MHPIFNVPVFCLAWLPAVTFASLDNSEYTTPLPIVPVTGSTQHAAGSVVSANDPIHILEAYLNHFESLAQSEAWQEMLAQGIRAVDAARRIGRYQDEVKIYAQLTLAAFYFGDYDLALVYVTQCHKLSENLQSPALLIRALYLESVVNRVRGGKNQEQAPYLRAVQCAEEALMIYQAQEMQDHHLIGNIYFNLGAAYADHPGGDISKAEDNYVLAIRCYREAHATDDLLRTQIGLGKIYLLQHKYDLTQQLIDEVRSQLTTERLAMHADYLEAQLKIARQEMARAISIAQTGLARAKALGAGEDEAHFLSLLQAITPSVALIACHVGPADHFATFAEDLVARGHRVQVYGSGPALKKLRDRHIKTVIPFFLDNRSEEEVAIELAQQCAETAIVITDVGHTFDILLQKALADHARTSLRLAYYDNPESYVPGEYSAVAALVMLEAQGTLFANANLARSPIYQAPFQEVPLAPERRLGLGYYPINQAEKMMIKRASEHEGVRAKFLLEHAILDQRQTILVYAGGNHEEYFTKAFPAFLQFVADAAQRVDLSHLIILLQQHPGAKAKNIDNHLVEQWLDQYGHQSTMPHMLVSELDSNEAFILADGVLYYQTSMGPQFVLAGIPTIQVGHRTYEDILVTNHLCSTATDADGFLEAIMNLPVSIGAESGYNIIQERLGLHAHWADRLEQVLEYFAPVHLTQETESVNSDVNS